MAKKEKKGGSFFNFLNVKEPSAQAFEDYQNQMRKKTQGKKGRPTAVGMPGVSSARLPPTVPKVNTKWDGVPQALKEKEKEKPKEKHRPSLSAGSTKETPGRKPAPISRTTTSHSNSSTGSGNRLAEIYGWDTPNSSSGSIAKDFALEHHKPKKTPSTTTLPETTLFPTHPRLPPRSISDQPPLPAELSDDIPPVPELPFNPAPYPELPPDSYRIPELPAEPAPIAELPAGPVPIRPKLQGPSLNLTAFMRRPDSVKAGQQLESPFESSKESASIIPPPRNPLRPPPVPELEGDTAELTKPPASQQTPLPSPNEWSPITPSGPSLPSPLLKIPDHQTDMYASNNIKQTIIEVPANSDDVVVVSSGINILGPPVSARRKPQRLHADRHQGFLAGEADEMTLPDDSSPLPTSILKKSSSPVRPAQSYFGAASPNKELVPGGATLRDKLGFGSASKSLSPHAPADIVLAIQREGERNTTPTPDSRGNGTTSRKKKGRAKVHRKDAAETR